MWKTVQGSVVGTSHQFTDIPCQDSHHVALIEIAGSKALLLVCSDGAGSAKLSERGSAFICEQFATIVGREIKNGLRIESIDRDVAIQWCEEIRVGLRQLATELVCDLRELAATFLGALVLDSYSCYFQIGDGAIVVQYDGLYEAVFWPQSGEYANTTNFLTDEKFSHAFEFSTRNGAEVTTLALFTDGLERLILHFADRTVHIPFLEPLFNSLQTCESPEQLMEPMRQFLSSDTINQRTDDDKTLILALRQALPHDGNATV